MVQKKNTFKQESSLASLFEDLCLEFVQAAHCSPRNSPWCVCTLLQRFCTDRYAKILQKGVLMHYAMRRASITASHEEPWILNLYTVWC